MVTEPRGTCVTTTLADATGVRCVIGIAACEAGSRDLWRSLLQATAEPLATDPEQPPPVPWAAIVIAETMRQQGIEEVALLLSICSVAGWAWIEKQAAAVTRGNG